MLSFRAVYDGKNFNFLEKVEINNPQEVIITFLNTEHDSAINALEIHKMVAQSTAFDFLKDEAEDIYSDADLKIKY